MCVKNSLMETKYTNSAHNNFNIIINIFKKAKSEFGVLEIPMDYFLTSTSLQKNDVYTAIHKLINCGDVSVEKYICCPYCLNEEKIDSENEIKRKCGRCKEYYDFPTIIEKFKLKESLYGIK